MFTLTSRTEVDKWNLVKIISYSTYKSKTVILFSGKIKIKGNKSAYTYFTIVRTFRFCFTQTNDNNTLQKTNYCNSYIKIIVTYHRL